MICKLCAKMKRSSGDGGKICYARCKPSDLQQTEDETKVTHALMSYIKAHPLAIISTIMLKLYFVCFSVTYA